MRKALVLGVVDIYFAIVISVLDFNQGNQPCLMPATA